MSALIETLCAAWYGDGDRGEHDGVTGDGEGYAAYVGPFSRGDIETYADVLASDGHASDGHAIADVVTALVDELANVYGVIFRWDSNGFDYAETFGDRETFETAIAEYERDATVWDGPQDDDYIITGTSASIHNGEHLGTFAEYDETVAAIREHARRSNYFPNVWNVSDHGNIELVPFAFEPIAMLSLSAFVDVTSDETEPLQRGAYCAVEPFYAPCDGCDGTGHGDEDGEPTTAMRGGCAHCGGDGIAPDSDVDVIAADVLAALSLPMELAALVWNHSGGEDVPDETRDDTRTVSFDYLAPCYDADELRAFVDYIGGDADEPQRGATPNMGIIGVGEYIGEHIIPGGVSWSQDGFLWNVGGVSRFHAVDGSAFPVTVDAARYLGVLADEREGDER